MVGGNGGASGKLGADGVAGADGAASRKLRVDQVGRGNGGASGKLGADGVVGADGAASRKLRVNQLVGGNGGASGKLGADGVAGADGAASGKLRVDQVGRGNGGASGKLGADGVAGVDGAASGKLRVNQLVGGNGGASGKLGKAMPRRNLRFVQGCYYHLYNRGAGRQAIVREERNYHYLLRLLAAVSAECQVSVIAYCLLPNHYHWLLRQDGETAAGEVPKRVFGSYTQAFNKAYQRSGTLFEGPFQAILVDTDAYLWNLCRYIHRNPVAHGIVEAAADWPYSNYREWVEQRSGNLVDRSLVRDQFPTAADYMDFMRRDVADWGAMLPY